MSSSTVMEGVQAVSELVAAFVGMRVGKGWRLEQGRVHHVALQIVPVFAVVQKRDSIVTL